MWHANNYFSHFFSPRVTLHSSSPQVPAPAPAPAPAPSAARASPSKGQGTPYTRGGQSTHLGGRGRAIVNAVRLPETGHEAHSTRATERASSEPVQHMCVEALVTRCPKGSTNAPSAHPLSHKWGAGGTREGDRRARLQIGGREVLERGGGIKAYRGGGGVRNVQHLGWRILVQRKFGTNSELSLQLLVQNSRLVA